MDDRRIHDGTRLQKELPLLQKAPDLSEDCFRQLMTLQ